MRDIVLDTNSLLGCISKNSPYRNVWDAFLAGEYRLCYTNEILTEYEEMLASKTTPEIAERLIWYILYRKNTRKLIPHFKYNLITADPDDNKFVNCAVAANAEYIVSNDHHFNVLKELDFPYLEVIRLQEFSDLCSRINPPHKQQQQ